MGKAPRAVFAAVLLVAALAAAIFVLKPREALTSTPSAYTGRTVPLGLPAGSEACADEVVFDTSSELVRFGALPSAGTTKAPPLEVTAKGYSDAEFGAYRNGYRSSASVEGGWTGERSFDVPLTPPGHAVFGYLCVRNLGEQSIDLVGSEDGRAYSRPSIRVDGEPTPVELQFRLLENGKHSLLSRVGETTAHAATLKPFGAWWWWALALALLAITPVAVYSAMKTSLVADAERGLDRDVARVALPFARLRDPLARIPGWAIVAAASSLAVVWLAYWSLSTHVFQNDEDQYVYLSRWLQTDFPSSLWAFDAYGRGLQRLEIWLLAIPSWLFDSPWSLRGGRVLDTLAFVSTAIPVYLLGRRLALKPQWAALPAVLSILVPWSVVTTGFLTENIAYPACLWAVWAIWRSAVEPSLKRDLLALVLLVVAGAARSGLLLLVPAFPLILAGVSLRFGGLRAALREHWLVWSAVAFGILVLLAGAVGLPGAEGIGKRLAGGYQTKIGFDVFDMLAKMGRYLAKVVIGTGFLPAAVALPWLVAQLRRPRDRASFAFALLVIVVTLALLYSLNAAGPDERYVLYLAPLVLLPATLAVARREVSPLGLGVGSALLALMIWRVPWPRDQGPFGYFVTPVEMFWTRTVGIRLDRYLPGGFDAALFFAAVALGAVGVALAVLLARRLLTPGRIGLVIAVVALLVPLQAQYALSKYVNGAGSKSAPSDRTRAFADTLVPKGEAVGEFLEGQGKTPAFFPLWQEVQFYNQRIDRVVSLGPNVNPVPPGDALADGVGYDPRTGRLDAAVPDYLVFATPVGSARLQGDVLHASQYVAVGLMRVKQPATLAWSAEGFDALGNVPPESEGRVRFYGAGCGTFTILAPPDRPARWHLASGDEERSGQVAATKTGRVAIPLNRAGPTDVRVTGDGVRVADINLGGTC
jgi:hypothetical protein